MASLIWVVTDSAPVSVHPPNLDIFNGEGFEVINFKGGGDSKPGVFHNTICKGPVLCCLRRAGSYSSTVFRLSSANWTTRSRGIYWIRELFTRRAKSQQVLLRGAGSWHYRLPRQAGMCSLSSMTGALLPCRCYSPRTGTSTPLR